MSEPNAILPGKGVRSPCKPESGQFTKIPYLPRTRYLRQFGPEPFCRYGSSSIRLPVGGPGLYKRVSGYCQWLGKQTTYLEGSKLVICNLSMEVARDRAT